MTRAAPLSDLLRAGLRRRGPGCLEVKSHFIFSEPLHRILRPDPRFSNSPTPTFFPSVSSNARLQERGSEREGGAGCQLNPPHHPHTPSRLTPLAGVLQRVERKRGGLSGGGLEGNSLSSSGGTAGDKFPVGKPDRGSSFLCPFFTRTNTEHRASKNNLTAAVRIGVESHAASFALGRSLLILILQVLFLFLPNTLSPGVFSSLTSCWTKGHTFNNPLVL